MKHFEGRFKGQSKLDIYYQGWLPAKRPRAAVVLAHGLGEHGGRYAHVAEALVADGYVVYAIDHRGHGKSSGGGSAYVDRWKHAVADMDTLVDLVRREQPQKPLFLVGHSMGGALSLSYSILHQKKLSGLVLSGPAVALDGLPPLLAPVAKFLSAVAPKLGLFAVDPSLVSRDPEMVAAYASDPLNAHGKVPVRTLGEIIRLVEFLPMVLSELKLPLLLLHGSDDKLAGVAGSRMVASRVSSQDKTLVVYDGLYHEIFNELPADRARVFTDMLNWLDARA
jgi:acylglycerol lipase